MSLSLSLSPALTHALLSLFFFSFSFNPEFFLGIHHLIFLITSTQAEWYDWDTTMTRDASRARPRPGLSPAYLSGRHDLW